MAAASWAPAASALMSVSAATTTSSAHKKISPDRKMASVAGAPVETGLEDAVERAQVRGAGSVDVGAVVVVVVLVVEVSPRLEPVFGAMGVHAATTTDNAARLARCRIDISRGRLTAATAQKGIRRECLAPQEPGDRGRCS